MIEILGGEKEDGTPCPNCGKKDKLFEIKRNGIEGWLCTDCMFNATVLGKAPGKWTL